MNRSTITPPPLRPRAINLKDPAVRLRHRGLSLDAFIEVATRNGYSCTFVYQPGGRITMRKLRPDELWVFVADGKVTEIW